MTIATAPTPLSYAGNGSTTAFPITWKYNSTTHVVATLRSSAGAETVWVVTTNYTITAAGDSGTLTAVVAPATGTTLFITLEPPNIQSSDIPIGGDLPSATIEDGLDLAAQRDGKIEALFNRALRVPKTDTQSGNDLELPIDSDRASKFLAFDANGGPIASVGTSDGLGPVTAFMATVLDDTTAAAARATLETATSSETVSGIKTFTGANTHSGAETHSGSETFTPIQFFTAGIGPNYLQNISILPSVSSKALTVALKTKAGADASSTDPIQIAFRNVTLTTGDYVIRSTTAATSVVAPNGATLGFIASQTGYAYVYALDNSGIPELILSGSNHWDEATVQSTTAISATADSGSVLYSSAARANVPIRYIGRIKIQTGAIAGEWDNAHTEVHVGGKSPPRCIAFASNSNSSGYAVSATFATAVNVLVGDIVAINYSASGTPNAAAFAYTMNIGETGAGTCALEFSPSQSTAQVQLDSAGLTASEVYSISSTLMFRVVTSGTLISVGCGATSLHGTAAVTQSSKTTGHVYMNWDSPV